MAHKKGGGATTKNRDSAGKRLGVKIYGGQFAKSGNIIARQRGTRFYAGEGTKIAKDHTIFAIREGLVKFRQKFGKKFIDVAQE
ncbi:50S ribosomal protein L27 [Candidatus Curtissbacteria bacterium RIFCSPHIGHO2_12_FULL_38_9b]|uniref:Large ribosomal subunit protein bL27 n=2 Tax=Candidatus Curtissiibacteriota TaxID=1752717 RepID=A0A1F5GSQ3_9BACT|nr:MAG: 50S ribosomal protein L27 [Candidatus Curtissbacteria bacterium RIFCSPHIGHO2_12_FULL_38_9b]OGD95302.1 MAG: 50S ribosomal protein L27 [Candidatus Curtissbacteria bacterium RIFCSPLOWO2_01_FULL_37_9]